MLLSDTIRSLVLVLISGTALWLFLRGKVKPVIVIVGLTLLILFDLISVNKKYVNADDFKTARKIKKPFTKSDADKIILQDKSHYRVANFAVDLMNDGSTSYYHNSIGGYHAAKLGRYQELFDFQIAKNNIQVFNMLNTKYFIIPDDEGKPKAQQNTEANGNVWFVDNLIPVKNANEEIQALDSLSTKEEAVILENDYKKMDIQFPMQQDTIATIALTDYKVTSLNYKSISTSVQFAVFSEIFYKEGWNAYIDGELVPHYRVNYVLRGMKIPAGNHKIEFKFEPKVIQQGKTVSLISYVLLFFISVGWFFYDKKKVAS